MLSRSPSRVRSSDLFSWYDEPAGGEGLRTASSCGALSISHDNDGLLRRRSYRDLHQAASSGESKEFKAARNKTTLVVNAASVLEKTDEQLLPSVYKYVNCSFQAGPDKLGYITAGRAVCQALASGLGGYLGHQYDRRLVIAAGCFIWGIMTMLFSFSSSWQMGALLWAWNGLGLAFVIPNSQSLIADFFDDVNRGKAFGTLYTTGAIGAMLGTAFATNVAGLTVLGEEGWRFSFRAVALVAMLIGWITLTFAADPNYLRAADGTMPPKHHNGSVRETVKEFMEVAKIPTFQVIILQGILGSTPWNALVFLTVYLQLIGFSNFNASLALSFFQAGAALGGVVGGAVGDWASKKSPNHGRIWACQFSVSMGIPFSLLLMKGLPQNGGALAVMLHVLTLFVFGLMHVWAAPACNNPVFAEIVPPSMRNLVYAFDRSFEGALAALGAPLVGIVAHDFFNFPKNANTYDCLDGKPVEDTDIAATHSKAQSLGNAMLVCMLIPWVLCLAVYSGLHFTYPRDRHRAMKFAEQLRAEAHQQESSPFVPQNVAGGVPTQPEFSLSDAS